MAKLTPEEYLKQKTEVVSDKKISPEEYLAQKNTTKDTRIATNKVQTPEEYLANKQKTTTIPQSTLQKAGDIAKVVAKDIYESAATIPVRAAQAEELLRTKAFGSPESQKKAMEFASQPVDIGFGTQVKPLDTSSIGRAAQQTAGDVLKTAALTNIGGKLTLAKQGALQGGIYGLGEGMVKDKPLPEIAKDVAIGTVGGAVVGKAINKFFPNVAPEVTTPVANKVDNVIPDAIPVPEVKPTPTAAVPETIKPATTKPVQYTKDPLQSLTKVMETELPPNTDPTFINTTLANQTARYDSVAATTNTDDLIDMAMGLKPTPEGLNPVAIHSLTSIRKDLTVEQAIRLKNIYPLSQAGQDLSLARLKSGAVIDNPVDMMQVVEKELKDQVVKRGISKNDIKNLFPDCGFN